MLQTVIANNGTERGKIYYESKRVKAFNSGTSMRLPYL